MKPKGAKVADVVAAGILVLSWLAAGVVAAYLEFTGWKKIVSDDEIASGLVLALIAAPFAFMTVQTVIGIVAVPFTVAAETLANDDVDWEGESADG